MKVYLVLGTALLFAATGVDARGPGPGGGGPPPPGGGQFQPGQPPPGQGGGGQQPPGQGGGLQGQGGGPQGQGGGQQGPGGGQQPPGQGGGQQPPDQAGQGTANSSTPDDLLNNSSLNLTSEQKAKIKKVRDNVLRQIRKVLTPAQLKTWRDGKYGKITVASVLAKSAALSLTDDQTAKLEKITAEASTQAKAVLTAQQVRQVSPAQFGMGPGGRGPGGGPPRGGPPGGGPPGGAPPGGRPPGGGGQFGPGPLPQGN